MSKKLLRKKLALMLANLKKKRKYYVECEFLESTGTQYIDTGYIPNQNSKAELTFQYTTQSSVVTAGAIFGERGSSSFDRAFCLATNSGTTTSSLFDIQFGDTVVGGDPGFDFNKHTIIIAKEGYWDGVLAYTSSSIFTGAYSCWLFGRQSTSNVTNPCKIYYCKIWDNDTLVRDFIPVLDWDMTPCMYDRVTEQLFYNQGTGDFVAGREIHPVEYIETDGTSFINTGYTPSGSTETEITTMLKDQTYSRFMFGCRSAQSTKTYACLAHNVNRIGYRVGDGSYTYSNGYNELNVKHTYKIVNGVFYRDGVVIDTTCQGATTSPNSPLALLTINTNNFLDTGQSFIGNLYSCTIKENNVLVRDYIPAIDENGVGYAFDRVTHTIFDNAGTGVFKYPAREVEYLESTGTQYINTGYVPTNTTGVQVKHTICANNGTDNILFGCRQDSGNTRFWEDLDWGNDDSVQWGYGIYSPIDSEYSIYRYKLIGSDIGKTVVSRLNYLNSRNCSIDDNIRNLPQTTMPTITRPIYIFAANNQGNAGYFTNFKVFCLQISEGTTIVRDFIPVYKDGALGMYDKANDVFYPNAGTGTFSVGRIIESEYE